MSKNASAKCFAFSLIFDFLRCTVLWNISMNVVIESNTSFWKTKFKVRKRWLPSSFSRFHFYSTRMLLTISVVILLAFHSLILVLRYILHFLYPRKVGQLRHCSTNLKWTPILESWEVCSIIILPLAINVPVVK